MTNSELYSHKRKVNLFFLLCFIWVPGLVNAQNMTRAEYISKYKSLAIEEMQRTGIPASITMAQGLLESANGNSRLAVKANNHFGIKCHSNWTGEKIYHDDDKRGECFRKYKSVLDSYKDHSDFLVNTPRYKSLFEYKSNDYKAWARGLKTTGYATSNTYDKDLIKIIEDNKLYELDGEIKASGYKIEKNNQSNITTFYNNGVEYIIAKPGETYESIAKAHSLMTFEIFSYNDLPKSQTKPDSGEIVYVKPKKNKAAKSYTCHIVQQGEELRTISQKYAIKVSAICKMNYLDENEQLMPGDTINLRKKKTTSIQSTGKENSSPYKKNTEIKKGTTKEEDPKESDTLEFKFEDE
jgi:LysM repeat protein